MKTPLNATLLVVAIAFTAPAFAAGQQDFKPPAGPTPRASAASAPASLAPPLRL